MKIICYATSNFGDGYSMKVGEYEELTDIEIRVGHFAKDVVLSFEEETDEKETLGN